MYYLKRISNDKIKREKNLKLGLGRDFAVMKTTAERIKYNIFSFRRLQ